MIELNPTCVWMADAALIAKLDDELGPPVDSYLNGSQTWLLPAGPREIVLEWRLHPVAGYQLPTDCSHHDLWELSVAQLANGGDPESLSLGSEVRSLSSLWDGLECFPAYGDELEPSGLLELAIGVLGLAPKHHGLVDHRSIGDAWERGRGSVSIVALLAAQLTT